MTTRTWNRLCGGDGPDPMELWSLSLEQWTGVSSSSSSSQGAQTKMPHPGGPPDTSFLQQQKRSSIAVLLPQWLWWWRTMMMPAPPMSDGRPGRVRSHRSPPQEAVVLPKIEACEANAFACSWGVAWAWKTKLTVLLLPQLQERWFRE